MQKLHNTIYLIVIFLFSILAVNGMTDDRRDSNIILTDSSSYVSDISVTPIYQNPIETVYGYIFCHFSIPDPDTFIVNITILDTTLNIVYEYKQKEFSPGRYQVMWNCENSQNEYVEPGRYYFNFVAVSKNKVLEVSFKCRQEIVSVIKDIPIQIDSSSYMKKR
jgi:hypothetical protein